MSSNDDLNEDELRARLHALGHAAEQGSPSFQRVWRTTQRSLAKREKLPGRPSAGWALATAAAAVCAIVTVRMNHPSPQAPVAARQVTAIASFEPATPIAFDPTAPTDFLLTTTSQSHPPSVQQLTSEINTLLNP